MHAIRAVQTALERVTRPQLLTLARSRRVQLPSGIYRRIMELGDDTLLGYAERGHGGEHLPDDTVIAQISALTAHITAELDSADASARPRCSAETARHAREVMDAYGHALDAWIAAAPLPLEEGDSLAADMLANELQRRHGHTAMFWRRQLPGTLKIAGLLDDAQGVQRGTTRATHAQLAYHVRDALRDTGMSPHAVHAAATALNAHRNADAYTSLMRTTTAQLQAHARGEITLALPTASALGSMMSVAHDLQARGPQTPMRGPRMAPEQRVTLATAARDALRRTGKSQAALAALARELGVGSAIVRNIQHVSGLSDEQLTLPLTPGVSKRVPGEHGLRQLVLLARHALGEIDAREHGFSGAPGPNPPRPTTDSPTPPTIHRTPHKTHPLERRTAALK